MGTDPQLQQPTSLDALDIAEVRRRLRTRRVGRPIEHHLSVTSTNDLALAAGDAPGLVVVADQQTAGRGRAGSRWEAPPGASLTFSAVVAVSAVRATAQLATMAASIAVATVLRRFGIARAHIKWPNDVLVGHRKISGVLCEARTRGGPPSVMVLGIGLNVNQVRAQLLDTATSMRVEADRDFDRSAILVELLAELEIALDRLEAVGPDAIRSSWESLSELHEGHRVWFEFDGREFEGITSGIDTDGALKVRRSDGEVMRVMAGGVRFAIQSE